MSQTISTTCNVVRSDTLANVKTGVGFTAIKTGDIYTYQIEGFDTSPVQIGNGCFLYLVPLTPIPNTWFPQDIVYFQAFNYANNNTAIFRQAGAWRINPLNARIELWNADSNNDGFWGFSTSTFQVESISFTIINP